MGCILMNREYQTHPSRPSCKHTFPPEYIIKSTFVIRERKERVFPHHPEDKECVFPNHLGDTFQGVKCERNFICPIIQKHRKGSYMVWEINMGVCPHLEFYNIMFIYCLGYDFYIYGAFEFLCNSIANL